MAILVAALYALCVVMPSAAVAFGTGERTPHCLTDEQLGLSHLHRHGAGQAHLPTHVHDDGATHRGAGSTHRPVKSNGDVDAAACCGLFGLTGLTADPQLDLGPPIRCASIFSISFEELIGRDPDRINRPPIFLPPL